MNKMEEIKKIEFKRISPTDRDMFFDYLNDGYERGCEFSFANLYLWGRQSFAELDGNLLLFSQFDRQSVYPFPIGKGDKRRALEMIIADSVARGIPCRITGMSSESALLLQQLFPDKFIYHCDEGSFDYVYLIDDLADLEGEKYHGKRNHIYRFEETYPDCKTVEITEKNAYLAKDMAEEWFESRIKENPNSDFQMERIAIDKALRHFSELDMVGLALVNQDKTLAFTLASRMNDDTFDVHFEKARADVQGTYPAINRALARYVREKYPSVKYLDREEDMGLEGLRRAKRSYHPHHMVEKYWAHLKEEGYEY